MTKAPVMVLGLFFGVGPEGAARKGQKVSAQYVGPEGVPAFCGTKSRHRRGEPPTNGCYLQRWGNNLECGP